MLRKKHFIEIAQIIGNLINRFINDLSNYFLNQNPNFDKQKFRDEIKKIIK